MAFHRGSEKDLLALETRLRTCFLLTSDWTPLYCLTRKPVRHSNSKRFSDRAVEVLATATYIFVDLKSRGRSSMRR
jgi:hypothetical protein